MNIQQYGQTKKETYAEDSARAREIVNEIINFGTTESQIIKVCYFLILELENQIIINDVGDCIKKYLDKISEQSEAGLITDI